MPSIRKLNAQNSIEKRRQTAIMIKGIENQSDLQSDRSADPTRFPNEYKDDNFFSLRVSYTKPHVNRTSDLTVINNPSNEL